MHHPRIILYSLSVRQNGVGFLQGNKCSVHDTSHYLNAHLSNRHGTRKILGSTSKCSQWLWQRISIPVKLYMCSWPFVFIFEHTRDIWSKVAEPRFCRVTKDIDLIKSICPKSIFVNKHSHGLRYECIWSIGFSVHCAPAQPKESSSFN